jgi:hypothetical protein
MVVGATLVEWALFPLAHEWATISDPAGYERASGEEVGGPAYARWTTCDVLGIVISAALAQGYALWRTSTLGLRGADDLDLLVFVGVQQVDLPRGAEVVARARQQALNRVFNLDAGH